MCTTGRSSDGRERCGICHGSCVCVSGLVGSGYLLSFDAGLCLFWRRGGHGEGLLKVVV